MSDSRIASFLMNLLNSVRSENLRWHQSRDSEVLALKQSKQIAKQALHADLKQRKAHFDHQLEQIKQKQTTELSMLKAQSKQQLRDYQEYLDSIDQLKTLIQDRYTHLPDAVALTIHHHTKQVLNQMWECEDLQQKRQHEAVLMQLMSAIHQDVMDAESLLPSAQQRPERTLEMISRSTD